MEIFTELDLSDHRVRGYVAGLRPFRHGSPRLEVERRGDKVVAHNYGHGGSGITMAWGSAAEIVDMLEPHLAAEQRVAVLGAGIAGLCTASLLTDRGHSVTIFARDFPPHTTSNVAGGLWAPTHVGLGQQPQEALRHERILRRSWHMFRELDSQLYGIEEVPLFETDDRRHPLDSMPEGLTDPPKRLQRMPFPGRQPGGLVSKTLLVQTSRFLKTLLERLKDRGVAFVPRTLEGPQDIATLDEPVLVNCLGLGSRQVAPDPDVLPIRGQLVLLDPAPRPFFMDHALGYIISRRDVLILGGTFEEGVADPNYEIATCREILNSHRKIFAIS